MSEESFPVEVEAPAPTPVPDPGSGNKVMDKLDRALIENLYLKVENIRLQMERMQSDIISASKMRQDLQKEMLDLQTSLSTKYSVDLRNCKILPDGTIIPG